ncbi:MAG: Fe-S cluster assembly ATPase SufC [Candidatus Wildermuthbacteria bacterium RIFCSPHIGHO2_12_FULL_40_12]|uniref:Fe-S cluster assembly ATPase SufC n=1 Tax=Candidatus Wildermuthbacteria bacterium RIFCSPHIGHO2_12_FULL_40_12 TaxID=1802457 RepID=A0A1G2REW2_9BACT|nr:MAG: Fe-S cluster assembly ATPase SufC [Candidatus Wildermuthbacteria bacterium RIFCSPHIGHO2_12_FULL_40_12]
MLKIKNLTVASEGKTIIQDINFRLRPGETHFLMGPNGAGKSTLGLAIMGHPNFKIKQGQVLFRKKNIAKHTTDQRAKMGIFLAFQQPTEFEGVKLLDFIKAGLGALWPRRELHTASVRKNIASTLQSLDMGQDFFDRSLNWGFSGGEKRKSEALQLLTLKPKLAILDEIDSGLDVDSLKAVAKAIVRLKKNSRTSFLVITHHSRIARFLKPDFVHIMVDGRIVKSGDKKLIKRIEQYGYKNI